VLPPLALTAFFNLQFHDDGVTRRRQEQPGGRDDVGVVQDRQNLELLLGLLPGLLPPIDELDCHLVAGQDFLAPTDDGETAAAEFLEFDVPPFEVALPASVQIGR
jgi:hypothetical protein